MEIKREKNDVPAHVDESQQNTTTVNTTTNQKLGGKRKHVRILLGFILIVSIIGNMVFFCSDGIPLIKVKYNDYREKQLSEEVKTIDEFSEQLLEASISYIVERKEYLGASENP